MILELPPELKRWTTSVEVLNTELPPVAWIVENWIPRNSLCKLEGWSGTWKTWILHNLVIALGCGGKWFGKFPAIKSRVMLVQGEENINEHYRKFNYTCAGAGLTADQMMNLDVIHLVRRVTLNDSTELKIFKDEVKAFQPDIVLMDSMRQGFAGDENSSEFARDVKGITSEVQSVHPCTFLFTHHQRKVSGKRELDAPGQRGRGSGALRDILDMNFVIDRPEGGAVGTMIHEKCRQGREQPSFSFTFDVQQGRALVCYEGITNDCSSEIVRLLTGSPQPLLRAEICTALQEHFTDYQVRIALNGLMAQKKIRRAQAGRQHAYELIGTGITYTEREEQLPFAD